MHRSDGGLIENDDSRHLDEKRDVFLGVNCDNRSLDRLDDSRNKNANCDSDNNEDVNTGLKAVVGTTVAGAINTLLRWSPQPTLKRKSGEVLSASSQDSQTSDTPVSMDTSCDFTSNHPSPLRKRSSAPLIQDKEDETKVKVKTSSASDIPLDSIGLNNNRNGACECLEAGDSIGKSESRKTSNQLEVPNEFVNINVTIDKSPNVKVTEKSGSTGSSTGVTERSPGSKVTNVERSSSAKGSERMSDSSRSSAEFIRAHSRERSFEKSLENIMDKCSERSLDLSISLESKNGTISTSDKTSFDDANNSGLSSKKSDKKKKNSPWYTMWSPSYKSRTEDFKKFFKDVPHDERLIVDYSCALQKDILVHGRMFLTQNWVCFYANIFRWETVLTVPCKEITAVTKERTARVIPNAIQIATDKDKHFFTSFGARDKTYMMLFRVWQNALLEQPMPPKELWQWVHYSYGEELGLTSSDDDYIAPPSNIEEQVEEEEETQSKVDNTDSSGLAETVDIPDQGVREQDSIVDEVFRKHTMEQPATSPDIPTDLSDTTEDSEGEVVCTNDHSHFQKQLLYGVYHLSVEKMHELLFTESPFLKNVHLSRRNCDLVMTPWEDDSSGTGNKLRTISYNVALNYSIGPKSSHTFEKQTFYKISKASSLYVIDAECTMAGIPYGDAFNVCNRYCLTRVTSHKSKLRITTEIRYRKSVWGLVKNMIEKNGYQGVEDFFKTLDAHLKRESEQQEQGMQNQLSTKRKLRKRRTRPGPSTSAMETPKLKSGHGHAKPGMSRHLSLMDKNRSQPVPPSPVHNVTVHREDISNLNADTLVRVILVVLVLLVIFNAILFYKLWSLEGYTNILYLPTSGDAVDQLKYPKSQEEWVNLLKQQQYLHEREIDKWKDILSSSISLIDQMKIALSQLKNSLDNRFPAPAR